MRSLITENLKPRPCRIDRAIARPIRKLLVRDFLFQTEYFMAFCNFCRPIIRPWALRENNTPELANQNARYFGYKHKPYNKVRNSWLTVFALRTVHCVQPVCNSYETSPSGLTGLEKLEKKRTSYSKIVKKLTRETCLLLANRSEVLVSSDARPFKNLMFYSI